MSERAVLVRIRGRVQGVGYRDWTQRRAMELGVDGWVRNVDDGSVEALLAGARVSVERMVTECRRGPPAAQVAALEEEDATAEG